MPAISPSATFSRRLSRASSLALNALSAVTSAGWNIDEDAGSSPAPPSLSLSQRRPSRERARRAAQSRDKTGSFASDSLRSARSAQTSRTTSSPVCGSLTCRQGSSCFSSRCWKAIWRLLAARTWTVHRMWGRWQLSFALETPPGTGDAEAAQGGLADGTFYALGPLCPERLRIQARPPRRPG